MIYTTPLLYCPFNPNPLSIPHPTLPYTILHLCCSFSWSAEKLCPTMTITGFWWIVSLISFKPYNPAHTFLWLIMLCVINVLGLDLASCWISLAPDSFSFSSLLPFLCGKGSGSVMSARIELLRHEWCWSVWTVCTHHLGFIAQPCHFFYFVITCVIFLMASHMEWGIQYIVFWLVCSF